MRAFVKENRVLLIIILAALTVSCIGIGGRFAVESKNKTYDIVLDYNEIETMASQSDHDISWWLKQFQEMGINKIGLSEENMFSLMENTDLPVEATIMDIVTRESDWEKEYPQNVVNALHQHDFDKYDLLIEADSKEAYDFIAEGVAARYEQDKYYLIPEEEGGYLVLNGSVREALYKEKYKYYNSMKKGFAERDELVSSKLMYLNLGMLPSKLKTAKESGMEIIPRTCSYRGWNDTRYANAVIAEYQKLGPAPEYMIVGGESVIGYDDGSKTAEDYLTQNNIKIGLIENTTQLQNILQYGVNRVVKNTDYQTVRIFSVWDYIQNRYQYYGYEGAEEIENTLFRAIVERNVRLIYFKPIKEYKDQHIYITNVDEYKTMFSNLENRLEKQGISNGTASIMAPYKVSLWVKLAVAVGCAAGAVLLLSLILPMDRRLKAGLLVLGVFGVGGVYTVLAGYAELLTSFAAAVIFPCLAVVFIVKQSRYYSDTLDPAASTAKIAVAAALTLTGGVIISLIGGIMTAAPISSINYMLEIDIFRGVKLAQLLPLAFFVFIYLAYFGYGERKKAGGFLQWRDLAAVMNVSLRIWMIFLGGIMAAMGAYYLMRTGHDSSVQVSSLEMIFRNDLEDYLLARPRNKEFLFAFPAAMMMVYTSVRRFRLWPVLFGLSSIIGMTSVDNTFMHIRTPLYLGFVRTGYSLLFGIVTGIVAILIFELGYQLIKRFERQISKCIKY